MRRASSIATSHSSDAVLKGVELLSSLPRGSGEMGFYVASEPTVPIRSVRIAADVPKAERTPLEVLRTNSATFRAVLEQRRQRHEPWFKFSPDHIDLCNVPLPVRAIPQAEPLSHARARSPPPDRGRGGGLRDYLNL